MSSSPALLNPLDEIGRFIEQARPIAAANSKPSYYLGSYHEDALFNCCLDFCEECATLVANRVSCSIELAFGCLGQTAPKMALGLWQARKEWTGLNAVRDWMSPCEIYPVPSSLEEMEYCDECGVLLDGFADPVNNYSGEWEYWEGRVKDGETALDADDIACLYYFLHESSDYSEEGKAACRRAADLLRSLDLSVLQQQTTPAT